jgi:glycosyltransferase involved in cell wall biosynthesis
LNIYINGRFLSQRTTGVQRYATELILALDRILSAEQALCSINSLTILVPKGVENSLNLKFIKVKSVGFFSGYLWEQLELPYHSKGSFLLNFCNMAPLFKRRSIVTICDVSVFSSPRGYSRAFLLWYRLALPIIGRMANSIITISDFSKAEIIKFLNIPEDKIKRIYLGVNVADGVLKPPCDSFLARVATKFKDEPFLLTVGSLNPNKNIKVLLDSIGHLRDLNLKVAVVGGGNAKIFGGGNFICSDSVEFFGYVSESELQWLYANATLFVFPSLYEGFGLPPLEAMIYGCPVIASSAASLPEVCGNAAIYLDPFNILDIASKIRTLYMDAEMQADYRERGFERVKNFTWDKCAIETLNLINTRLVL